ncbi:MAG: hypothetical protein MRJ68_19380 [Nitrospira sp.]|nr:hypothetical protein [Nitrospira sp.]
MKVRHKKTGVELEICPSNEAFARRGDVYRRTTGGSFINTSDPDWQLVPEEEWEDVTGNLEVTDGIGASEPQEKVWAIQCLAQKYRLRKIDGLHNGPAFIVERRKES